jgi:hypothetical protein
MKRISWILIIIVIIFSNTIILAEMSEEGIKLTVGKNLINLSFEFSPINVQDLIRNYPEISTITSNESGIIEGYVNVFGGIGKNFLIESNKEYEIITKKEEIITLK